MGMDLKWWGKVSILLVLLFFAAGGAALFIVHSTVEDPGLFPWELVYSRSLVASILVFNVALLAFHGIGLRLLRGIVGGGEGGGAIGRTDSAFHRIHSGILLMERSNLFFGVFLMIGRVMRSAMTGVEGESFGIVSIWVLSPMLLSLVISFSLFVVRMFLVRMQPSCALAGDPGAESGHGRGD